MALTRIGWENGTLVESGKVLSDGTIQEAQYQCNTPLSAENLTKMEDNIEDFVNEEIENISASFETGTSGIWTYRNWADGTTELWGHTSLSGLAVTSTWGSLYVLDDAIPAQTFPVTFASIPYVQASLLRTGTATANAWLYTGNTIGTVNATPAYGIARGSSNSSGTYEVDFYVFGTRAE